MQITSIQCSQCGAPLEIPLNIHRVSCLHCGSSLIVQRNETTAFTELANSMVDAVAQLSGETKRLSSSLEIQELDRQWEQRQRQLETVSKSRRTTPTIVGGVFQVFFVSVFGLAWTAMAIAITSWAPPFGPFILAKVLFPLFGIFFVLMGVVNGFNTISRAHQYQSEKDEYLRKRKSIGDRNIDQ